ncbi:helix-turn-helix domain-containing protein [Salinigranum halophilum]|uniref:helix-turn-helix domain-containing protein n=1 Tax=Salinigranum halophilum TaxID=2565931 RepID=UPI0010A8A4B4|nr:helix-turn-helix domain-containing protein [Salinigranum halophilum]
MSSETVSGGTRLTLDLWHPNCWAIEATSACPGGILAHAIYDAPAAAGETVNGLFTAYGESADEVETLLEHIRDSRLTGGVQELKARFGQPGRDISPGNAAREFFLEYDPNDMICPKLVREGFVHSAPCRIEDGREYWQVVYAGERDRIEPKLDVIRDEEGADIDVARIASSGSASSERARRLDTLTPSQREVFDLAREHGYYEWPRGVSTRELADELDVSKTTLLEHLRKAEAKLLDP